jgi:hypothetical protein
MADAEQKRKARQALAAMQSQIGGKPAASYANVARGGGPARRGIQQLKPLPPPPVRMEQDQGGNSDEEGDLEASELAVGGGAQDVRQQAAATLARMKAEQGDDYKARQDEKGEYVLDPALMQPGTRRNYGPLRQGYDMSLQKERTYFRRDEAKKRLRPRSPTAEQFLAALVAANAVDAEVALQVLQSTPRKKGNYFKAIKDTKQGQLIREKALATRLVDREALVEELRRLSGPDRVSNREMNMMVKAMKPGKAKRNGGRALYNDAPLSHLLPSQRAYLSKRVLDKVSVDPEVAVQLFSRNGGIASPTRCAAAVRAAKLASRATYGSANAKYTGGPVDINLGRKPRNKGPDMTNKERAAKYRGLLVIDEKNPPKVSPKNPDGLGRADKWLQKIRDVYGVPEAEIQNEIINAPAVPKQPKYEPRAANRDLYSRDDLLRLLEQQRRLLAQQQL